MEFGIFFCDMIFGFGRANLDNINMGIFRRQKDGCAIAKPYQRRIKGVSKL